MLTNLSRPAHTLTLWLVGVHVLCMLLIVVASVMNIQATEFFIARSDTFLGWALYAFYHNIASKHLFFAIEMLMLYWFGHEVEQRLGIKKFGLLYALLVLLPPLVFSVWNWITPLRFELLGSSSVNLSVFIAFACLAPHTPVLFSLTAKWAAIIFLTIHVLSLLSSHAWLSLGAITLNTLTVLGFIKYQDCLDLWDYSRRQAQERHTLKESEKIKKAETDFQRSVDDILEKISKHGMQSLNANEKKRLEQARAQLLKKQR